MVVKAGDIIDKYEVPKEYHEAIFEAYAEGAKRGFIKASVAQVNEEAKKAVQVKGD